MKQDDDLHAIEVFDFPLDRFVRIGSRLAERVA